MLIGFEQISVLGVRSCLGVYLKCLFSSVLIKKYWCKLVGEQETGPSSKGGGGGGGGGGGKVKHCCTLLAMGKKCSKAVREVANFWCSLSAEVVALLVDAEPRTVKETKSIIDASMNGEWVGGWSLHEW